MRCAIGPAKKVSVLGPFRNPLGGREVEPAILECSCGRGEGIRHARPREFRGLVRSRHVSAEAGPCAVQQSPSCREAIDPVVVLAFAGVLSLRT